MEGLSVAYQAERAELEAGDPTALVIRALCRYAVSAACDGCDGTQETPDRSFSFSTSAIAKVVKDLAAEIEADLDPECVTAQRVGRVPGKMRLQTDRTRQRRGWLMTIDDLLRWLTAYGIEPPDEFAKMQTACSEPQKLDTG